MNEQANNPITPSAAIDRRTALRWILAAGAGVALGPIPALARRGEGPGAREGASGYGTDPVLNKTYQPGDFWPLTLTAEQRGDAAVLCDLILPADERSPSPSSVGIVDFLDEWVSAPYPDNRDDARLVADGMQWLSAQSAGRFGTSFARASREQQLSLCEELASEAKEGSSLERPAAFFRRFRDLTMGGFYTTPAGLKDIGYVGNLPQVTFAGPPADLVERMGLKDEVAW